VEIVERVPCTCGLGELEVGLKHFGQWRVERLLKGCPSCSSVDVSAARKQQKQFPVSYSLLSLM
jgi:hypothetical protein